MKSRLKGKKVIIGNIYVPPNNEEQLHTLDKILESLKNETIIIGDFNNARNTVCDKHVKQYIHKIRCNLRYQISTR